MIPAKGTFQVVATIAVLVLFGLSVGCSGFFVDPTLTGITVGPSNQSLNVGSTLQMSARGTYDDGSSKTITGSVTWSSSSPDVATISSGGLVTGVASGTTTISADQDTIEGQATVNVVLNNVTALQINPTNPTVIKGGTQNFTCTATVSGQSTRPDVTATVTWALPGVTDSSISITNGQNPAVLSVTTSAQSGTYQLTATYPNNVTTSTNFTVP
jgi:hypothetical protein